MSDQDEITQRTGLDAAGRRARAVKGGRTSHTVSNYVERIVRRAPELGPEDLATLRHLVGPVTEPEVYQLGLKTGARMMLERIVEFANAVEAA